MLRIIGERGNGKTVAAVAVAKAFNAILVVPHRDMPPLDCDNSELLYSYPYVCSYNDIRKIVKIHFRENGLREINIVFDELPLCQFDDFLNYFVNKTRGVHIDLNLIAYTCTIDKDF